MHTNRTEKPDDERARCAICGEEMPPLTKLQAFATRGDWVAHVICWEQAVNDTAELALRRRDATRIAGGAL